MGPGFYSHDNRLIVEWWGQLRAHDNMLATRVESKGQKLGHAPLDEANLTGRLAEAQAALRRACAMLPHGESTKPEASSPSDEQAPVR